VRAARLAVAVGADPSAHAPEGVIAEYFRGCPFEIRGTPLQRRPDEIHRRAVGRARGRTSLFLAVLAPGHRGFELRVGEDLISHLKFHLFLLFVTVCYDKLLLQPFRGNELYSVQFYR